MKTTPTDRLTPKTKRSRRGEATAWLVAIAGVILLHLGLALSSGCSTLAEYGERAVPALFTPTKVVLEQDRAHLEYDYCVQDDACVHRVSEFTRFEITTEDGETIACVAVYQRFDWPDGSTNRWLWPSPEGDPRCEEEMERLAEQD